MRFSDKIQISTYIHTYIYIFYFILFFWPWSLWDFSSRSPPWAGPQEGKYGVPGLPGNFPKSFLFIVPPLLRENRLYTFSKISTQACLILQLQQNWSYKEPTVLCNNYSNCSPVPQKGGLILVGCKWPSAGWALTNYQEISDIWQNQINENHGSCSRQHTNVPEKQLYFMAERHELTFHISLQGNVQNLWFIKYFFLILCSLKPTSIGTPSFFLFLSLLPSPSPFFFFFK